MSNRVLNRRGARELMPEEMDQIAGGVSLHTLGMISGAPISPA